MRPLAWLVDIEVCFSSDVMLELVSHVCV